MNLLAPCPTGKCEHSAYVHDIYSSDDPRHSCCIDDCPCGPDDPDPNGRQP